MEQVKCVNSTIEFPAKVDGRITVVGFLDVVRSNPNGDPDQSGAPRMDRAGHGWMSSGALKRHLRTYLITVRGEKHYIAPGVDLGAAQVAAGSPEEMTRQYRDLRLFGGVLTKYLARVRGPVVVRDAVSVEPVEVESYQITRVGHVTGETGNKTGNYMSTSRVRYGLYRFSIVFDPVGARDVQFTQDDLQALWESLGNCWDYTRSAVRPNLNLRAAVLFRNPDLRGGIPGTLLEQSVGVIRTGTGGGAVPTWLDYPSGPQNYEIRLAPDCFLGHGIEVYSYGDVKVVG